MNQSDRIRMYKDYCNHPLKKEYEEKEEKICKNKPKSVKLIYAGNLFFLIMFFVYGRLASEYIIEHPVVFLLGVGNIISGLLYCGFQRQWAHELTVKHKKKELDALDKEYLEKGLIKVTEDELYKAPCGELDSDYGMICSVTKLRLSIADYCWCQRPGNCRRCQTFISYVNNPDCVKTLKQSNKD